MALFDLPLEQLERYAPAHFGVGLRDTVCPPSTAFAAYNHYGTANREMHVYPFNHHEGGDAYHTARQLRWLRALIGLGC